MLHLRCFLTCGLVDYLFEQPHHAVAMDSYRGMLLNVAVERVPYHFWNQTAPLLGAYALLIVMTRHEPVVGSDAFVSPVDCDLDVVQGRL